MHGERASSAVPDHNRHLPCAVQVEEGTPFARWYAGSPALPQEPDAVTMYELASSTLASAGYAHYEVRRGASSAARSSTQQLRLLAQLWTRPVTTEGRKR